MTVIDVLVVLLYNILSPIAIINTLQKAKRSIPFKKLFKNSPCSPIPKTPNPVYIIILSEIYWTGVLIIYSTTDGKYAKDVIVNTFPYDPPPPKNKLAVIIANKVQNAILIGHEIAMLKYVAIPAQELDSP